MKNTIRLFLPAIIFCAPHAYAGGYTAWAVPSQLEYVNGGILVSGNFGDINSCGQSGHIFVMPSENDQNWFQSSLSILLTAFAAQKEIKFYTQDCTSVSFHWGPVENINAALMNGFYIR
jgi:hypothetical protein